MGYNMKVLRHVLRMGSNCPPSHLQRSQSGSLCSTLYAPGWAIPPPSVPFSIVLCPCSFSRTCKPGKGKAKSQRSVPCFPGTDTFSQDISLISTGRQPLLVHCASFFASLTLVLDWRLEAGGRLAVRERGSLLTCLTLLCLALRSPALLTSGELVHTKKLGHPIHP